MKHVFRNFEENVAAGLMGWLLVVLFLQVFTRYVLNDPLSWTEEMARYTYVYIVFLGSAAAISHRTHVSIDFIVKALPRVAQWTIAFAINLLILVVLANLIFWGIIAARRQLNLPLVVLDIPYTWVYVVVPFTAATMSLRTIAVMREDWARMREGAAVESETRSGL